jgi:anthranilate phosphoribosyltransferase
LKKILLHLFDHKNLSRSQAREILINISNGSYNEHEVTAFVTVFLMRSITLEELNGFRDALLEVCMPLSLDGFDLLDIVGTGGDNKNTFNISTLSCFIVAGAGQPVAKHGNYGASSVSGASNVMEQLGYTFKNNSDQLKEELSHAGICFLHAPIFHKGLKNVALIRKNLATRTFFNMLGPLVNPAQPSYQLIGVYNLEMARLYNYLLQQTQKRFTIIHSLDGYDEISLTNDTKVITRTGEKILSPEYLGKRRVMASDLLGGQSVEEAASIFKTILQGKGTWAQNAVVLANAAMGLYSTEKFESYQAAYDAAVDSLDKGKAWNTFEKLLALQ